MHYNIATDCLDEKLAGHGDQKALVFAGTQTISLTYSELKQKTDYFAHNLKRLGLKKKTEF